MVQILQFGVGMKHDVRRMNKREKEREKEREGERKREREKEREEDRGRRARNGMRRCGMNFGFRSLPIR